MHVIRCIAFLRQFTTSPLHTYVPPKACTLIASSTLIGQLYQLWEEKGDDTELLLQLIHCFHK